MNLRVIPFVIIICLYLSSCGGGGGDEDVNTPNTIPPSTPPPAPPPPPPVTETVDDVADLVEGHPFYNSPHSKPIVTLNNYLYVVNTPLDTLDDKIVTMYHAIIKKQKEMENDCSNDIARLNKLEEAEKMIQMWSTN